MLDNIFSSIFTQTVITNITGNDFFICILTSLCIGFFLAIIYKRRCRGSQSFVSTIAVLPSIVCVIIMLVNGNLGAGVAVAGTFGLVRFRSAPGTAKEISAIFVAMAAGLATGMGYLVFAVVFTLILCVTELFYSTKLMLNICSYDNDRLLKITIPEDLDYSGVFDDILESYLVKKELMEVKTTNLGSLFRLTYNVSVKCGVSEKKMIDEIRCRNGNLEVSLSKQLSGTYEL